MAIKPIENRRPLGLQIDLLDRLKTAKAVLFEVFGVVLVSDEGEIMGKFPNLRKLQLEINKGNLLVYEDVVH